MKIHHNLRVKNLVLLVLPLFLFINHCFGQSHFKTPEVWVKPEAKDLKASEKYIGNYPVLEKNELLKEAFKAIGEEKGGMLFLVGFFPENETALEFGKVSLTNTTVQAAQHELTLALEEGMPAIVKVDYQISSKYKKADYEVFISNNTELAEVIFYSERLSAEEIRSVETYLALKYSINITANTDNEKRLYLSTDSLRLWNYSTDQLYDAEVLGLGRNDAIGFYQSQSFSSDSKSLKLSFENDGALGDMPEKQLEDGSQVILSKKNTTFENMPCGSAQSHHPWKLRFHKWVSTNPETLYLLIDSIENFDSNPYITDGSNYYPLPFMIKGEGVEFEISIKDLDYTKDYFMYWDLRETPCDPLAEVNLIVCDALTQQANGLLIEVNNAVLDVQVKLIHTQTGKTEEFELFYNTCEITGLEKGQYELVVISTDGPVLNKVFEMEDCSVASGDLQINQSNLQHSLNQHSNRGITAYPNPSRKNSTVNFQFWGFEQTQFNIQISDPTGRVVDRVTYSYFFGNPPFEYSFKDAGSYTVQISSEQYTEVKTIIIQ